jgi:hypothetical protein
MPTLCFNTQKMKIILLLITACLFYYNNYAQPINLVPNGSFEQRYSTSDILDIDNAIGWFGGMLSPKYGGDLGGSTDYYHTSNTVHDNPFNAIYGAQYPRTGNAFAGFFPFGFGSIEAHDTSLYCWGEMIAVRLLDSLQKDSTYTLSFWVSTADYSLFATNAFTAYFSIDSFFSIKSISPNTYNRIKPQFDYRGPMVYDTLGWTNIKCNFVAEGGEQFMSIGCHYTRCDSLRTRFKQIIFETNNRSCSYYQYIDDVELYPATAPCYYPREAGTSIPYVPPVPPPVLAPIVPTWVAASAGAAGAAQGRLVVQHLPPHSSLWLYNALGQLVYQSANYANDYSFLQQNAAMYFYILRTPTQTLKGKILVTQ